MLRRFRQNLPEIRRFWADELSPCDLHLSALTGPRQIAEAWAAALAIPWQAVPGADERLVERIA